MNTRVDKFSDAGLAQGFFWLAFDQTIGQPLVIRWSATKIVIDWSATSWSPVSRWLHSLYFFNDLEKMIFHFRCI